MNNIQVRKATLEDLPTLLKFEQGIITTERPFDETLLSGEFHYYDLAERIRDADAEVVVADINGVLVGGGSAIIKEGNTTHCNMMVDKYWKGKKIPGIEYNRKCKVCLMKSGYGNL